MSDILALKKKLAQAIRVLSGGEVLTLTVGHAALRIGPDRIIMLGHSHKSFKTLDTITEDEIIEIDMDGNLIDGRYEPPGEFYIHTEIMKARPDVKAIVHGHPLMSKVFGIAGRPIVPVDPRARTFSAGVPVMDFAGQVDTPELGQEAARILGDKKAMLLRGHGQIVVGETLEEACCNAFTLESNAMQLYMALQIGTPQALREDECKAKKGTSVWVYYVKKFDPMFEIVGHL